MSESPQSLNPYQAEIVERCRPAVRVAAQDFKAPRVVQFEDYVVKFNQNDPSLFNEADTQSFVYATALKSSAPSAPRIPEVYECFLWDKWHYLVMERIQLPTIEDWIKDDPPSNESRSESSAARAQSQSETRFEKACEAVSNALTWLFSLSPPPGSDIGLIQGPYSQLQSPEVRDKSGYAFNRFFGSHYKAPIRYTNADALERHINMALKTCRGRNPRPMKVNFSDEPLVMVQDVIKAHNFLIDPQTLQVTLLNFGSISVLPRSFASYTLSNYTDAFSKRIYEVMNWERSGNMSPMVAATGLYWLMTEACKCFGLDKHGVPDSKFVYRSD
ncbi:hypothetical protein EST38_g3970 [Candolleomyces aberdarensis]|uniref:Uncharacterized protein n=1 Tax=Candolleomyces aberdarensis TaxID=2316362 RepID=A0A4Q2DNN9_9AGAR|nr:hypothetical protein EST38_g3970 [Candolleomyces aberdarensis]